MIFPSQIFDTVEIKTSFFLKRIAYIFNHFTSWYNNCPFPKRQTLDSSNLKEFADDNFRFDEKGRQFSKRVENIVGKGEIARYEQFLLFP